MTKGKGYAASVASQAVLKTASVSKSGDQGPWVLGQYVIGA